MDMACSGKRFRGLPRRVVIGMAVLAVLAGCSSVPPAGRDRAGVEVGLASYYADHFHGRRTASGERYDREAYTAAHRRLPFGAKIQVINLANGRKVDVRINDRGPFVRGRVIDLSYAAARELGMLRRGVVEVRLAPIP